MRRTSWMKPMSSIRSASSSTKVSTQSRRTYPWFIRSHRRPGQAMTVSAPLCMASTWLCWLTPPKMTQGTVGRPLP